MSSTAVASTLYPDTCEQLDASCHHKRKITSADPNRRGEKPLRASLNTLVDLIQERLDEPVANDTLHLCGHAPLAIIAQRPVHVLDLAYQELNATRYSEVETRWRRLYEEATLHKVLAILGNRALVAPTSIELVRKRCRLDHDISRPPCHDDAWIEEVVTALDKSIIISGCPGRRALFDDVFQLLDGFLHANQSYYDGLPQTYNINEAAQLSTLHNIRRHDAPIGLESFQIQLESARPCIIPGIMEHWPALRLWQDPSYLFQITLGGRRLVPVEIGSSYTEAGWAQRMMSIREFLETYVLSETPSDVGYLAQHDLFEQLPALKNDIVTPDYCYTSPPDADESTLKTAGLSSVLHLDEPLRNAWFGPKGTRTPLHTDPYHNILCQVVGYKYVRLYAPSETSKLYPRGVDENGISMENTSQIDISLVRLKEMDLEHDVETVTEQDIKFPLSSTAEYAEAVLAPGQCLYIPVGWWHYVESLSTSFSVSFWWN